MIGRGVSKRRLAGTTGNADVRLAQIENSSRVVENGEQKGSSDEDHNSLFEKNLMANTEAIIHAGNMAPSLPSHCITNSKEVKATAVRMPFGDEKDAVPVCHSELKESVSMDSTGNVRNSNSEFNNTIDETILK